MPPGQATVLEGLRPAHELLDVVVDAQRSLEQRDARRIAGATFELAAGAGRVGSIRRDAPRSERRLLDKAVPGPLPIERSLTTE